MKMFEPQQGNWVALLLFWQTALASVASSLPALSIQKAGTNAVIVFTGRLESAARPNGPYTNVGNAASPYLYPTMLSTNRFWRARQQSPFHNAGGYARFCIGHQHSVALRDDGSLWTWGDNWHGQLGNGTFARTNTLQHILSSLLWKVVASGDHHNAAISEDGQLWAWGYNHYGQLGTGAFSPPPNYGESTPRAIEANRRWKAVTAGRYFTLALLEDGTLWSWGDNSSGQLGVGVFSTNSPFGLSSPQPVMTNATWKAISAGSGHALALRNDGTLWAWGYNQFGQVGDGTTTDRCIPVQVVTNQIWAAISAGSYHNMALASNGTLWAWGYGVWGQLGDGRDQHSAIPIQIEPNTHWISVGAGGWETLAIASDGKLWGWGANLEGQVGDGTWIKRSRPVQVRPDMRWTVAAAGSLALAADGTLWSWGYEDYGRLGREIQKYRATPLQIATNKTWIMARAGGGNPYCMAIDNDGALWEWGFDISSIPIPLITGKRWSTISVGYSHLAAIASDGTLWVGGDNSDGQLGLGSGIHGFFPTQTAAFKTWRSVSVDGWHTLALAEDGTLWTWGDNYWGQVGDGTFTDRYSPTAVMPGKTWKAASSAGSYNIAVATDGTLWYWGSDFGFYGTTNRYNRPFQIAAERTWRTASAGNRAYAIATDGTLWGLGRFYSQLTTNLAWNSVDTGRMHNLAVTSDRQLWAWGSNQEGEIGDGTRIDRPSPIHVATERSWIDACAGGYFTLAIASDGKLWSWGSNTGGTLGDGMTSIDPAPIGSDTNWGPP